VQFDPRTRATPSPRVVETLRSLLAPLDPGIARRFDLYCWQAQQLRTHSLLVEGRDRIVALNEDGIRFPPLTPQESVEAFESMCLRFRRLELAKASERTTFTSVRGEVGRLIRRHPSEVVEETSVWLEELKVRRAWLLNRWGSLGLSDLTPATALDLAFNGELFHLQKEAELEQRRVLIFSALYHQISFFSLLYSSLATALETALRRPAISYGLRANGEGWR
jgi:hypothetical protein